MARIPRFVQLELVHLLEQTGGPGALAAADHIREHGASDLRELAIAAARGARETPTGQQVADDFASMRRAWEERYRKDPPR